MHSMANEIIDVLIREHADPPTSGTVLCLAVVGFLTGVGIQRGWDKAEEGKALIVKQIDQLFAKLKEGQQ